MNLGTQILRAVNRFHDKIAIIDGETKITYREMNNRANRLANALSELGLKKGDRVAFLMPNCWQAVIGDIACYKTGLVKVPLNARLSTQELVHMLNNSESHALIMSTEFTENIDNARAEIKTVQHYIAATEPRSSMIDLSEIMSKASEEEPNVEVDMDDLYGLFYTSGTSGVLKAAMLTHRNWLALARTHLTNYGRDRPNKTVVTCYIAPITHAAGAFLMTTFIRGGRNVLLASFDIESLFKTIETEQVTEMLLIPVMINFMLATPGIENYDLSSLEVVIYGTAPMAPSLIKEALEVFGPVLTQGYGQTEATAVISSLFQEDHLTDGDPVKEKRLSSAGLPAMEIDLKIVDESGREMETGEIGEIIIRGENVMKGYWKAPELTADTIRDGWLYTRDMGYIDEGGYMFLVDRKSDMIISGGFNIYPSEVENVLYDHPAVFEAAVVGVPDEQWGEAVQAVVVLKPGMSATEEEIIQFCKENLGSYKKPKSVSFADDIPKNPTGKVLRRLIKEPYWKNHDRLVN